MRGVIAGGTSAKMLPSSLASKDIESGGFRTGIALRTTDEMSGAGSFIDGGFFCGFLLFCTRSGSARRAVMMVAIFVDMAGTGRLESVTCFRQEVNKRPSQHHARSKARAQTNKARRLANLEAEEDSYQSKCKNSNNRPKVYPRRHRTAHS
jgi:hypothetical protein